MSTDLIRRAVSLMRERANAATSGPWEVLDSIHRDPYILQVGRGILRGGCVAFASGEDYGRANAEHIASWDPVVALAVADMLEVDADVIERHDLEATDSNAYAVAVAYLGEES